LKKQRRQGRTDNHSLFEYPPSKRSIKTHVL
jgi:hypothetical protein